jgi:hypothetical protein
VEELEQIEENNIDYPIRIKFGEGREFNFRTWKGHERRLLREHISKDTLDDNTIADIVVYGCMETPVFLNPSEIIYSIHTLRKASFNTPIEVPFECECSHEQPFYVDEFKNFKLQEITDMVIGDKTFYMKQPSLPLHKMQEVRKKNSMEQTYSEMLLHINYFVANETKYDAFNLEELDMFFDNNLSIEDFDSSIKKFSDMRFKFEPTVEVTCDACGETTEVTVDYIEEIFN